MNIKGKQGFQKGTPGYWIGKHHSAESKKKMSLLAKGRKSPWKGKTGRYTQETKQKMSNSRKGIVYSQETLNKMSKAQEGLMAMEKHWNWKGGISFIKYPTEFNLTLKIKIRERDKYTCCLCGRTEREELEELNRVLCINHIDFDKQNCKESNLNTLCLRCNVKINREREYYTNLFQQL